MFYVFSKTPSAANTKADPFILPMQLSAGVIHQVDVLFQSGAAHEEFVQIHYGGTQLWPSNRGEYLRGNATVISFREFIELPPGLNSLDAHISTTLSGTFYEVLIQIGILPKRIIQPLSFEELLNAASGT